MRSIRRGVASASCGVGCLNGHNTGVTEQYSYHPAGAVTGKQFQVKRCGTDGGGNFACPTAAMNLTYTYDGAGQVASVTYPGSPYNGQPAPQPYVYGNDGYGRHVSLSQMQAADCTNDNPWPLNLVQNVQFDSAGRMSSLQFETGMQGYTYGYSDNCGGWGYYPSDVAICGTESRTYNVDGQLTTLGWSSSSSYNWAGKSVTYTYSATQNNGQITQMTDLMSGETATYKYDQLKRLTQACSSLNPCAGSPPQNQYLYDGFGNLTSRTEGGTTTPIPVNPATNQLTYASYDLNGNMTGVAGATLTYDEANRVLSASPTSGGIEYYGYAPDNKRVWHLKSDGVTEEWTLYGAKGEKIGVYQWSGLLENFNNQGNWTGDSAGFVALRLKVRFDGRLVSESGNVVIADRLGSNRAGPARFYPYGTEGSSTSNDRVKFARYTRDSFTGLDYADQRFYASVYGRFNSVDRSTASEIIGVPNSWNRYAYVGGDPINLNDPSGLDPICGPYGTFDGEGCIYEGGPTEDAAAQAPASSSDYTVGVSDDGTLTFGIDVTGSSDGSSSDSEGDDDDDVGADPVDDPEPIPQMTVNSCVAGSAAFGALIGATVGAGVFGTAGGAVGALGGSVVGPGGTLVGGWVGGEIGSTAGTLIGTTVGGAAGALIGNIFCSNIGPSGKYKIHVVRHPTKKQAREAAKHAGEKDPMHHPKPTVGEPHYHPVDGNGDKIPGVHHAYPWP